VENRLPKGGCHEQHEMIPLSWTPRFGVTFVGQLR
jgi:hypothetical protein